MTLTAPTGTVPLAGLLPSWRRHLRAENKADRTEQSYLEAAGQLVAFLAKAGMPLDVSSITREHVEAFMVHLLGHHSESTAANRYRSLRLLFRWCIDEGEIHRSPMERMHEPKVTDQPVPVVSEADRRRLLATCGTGRDFVDRRDLAILRLFVDTPARISEIAGLRWVPDVPELCDVDLDARIIVVTGKGSKVRPMPIGAKTIKELDRYTRLRPTHRAAPSPRLWLGKRGPMTDSGIRQMIERRAAVAGIEAINPHQFRHTFAHEWKLAGGNDDELMELCGWTSREMLGRYGRSAVAQRARESHRRFGPGDRL